ncbi:hypothetical protein JIR001_28720 [Polycladomyces abyssicola]|jgi:hypothetical protein|uniref:Uncharacterized protein n=1 Tax=Polycladomyces abyssicola TaxID=1125966 RepID=A0A8D5UH72_9BACL|nr:hypothetical protein JIR001_28720 [Polycladomyces abyssicola]
MAEHYTRNEGVGGESLHSAPKPILLIGRMGFLFLHSAAWNDEQRDMGQVQLNYAYIIKQYIEI